MAELGETITEKTAGELFEKLGIQYKAKTVKGNAGGKVIIGSASQEWVWTKTQTIPPKATGVRNLLATVDLYRKHYVKAKGSGKGGGKSTGTGTSTKATGGGTATKRAKKTEAAYWYGYADAVLDQITSAIAEAKATAKRRQRAETARRTVVGLEELGMPVSDELRALAGKAEAPKTEAETIPALFGGTVKGETPAAESEK